MDIAFAFDEHYARHVQVTIESILQQHPGDRDITFWIMTTKEGLTRLTEPLLRQVENRARIELFDSGETFRNLPLQCPESPWITEGTRGMYIRLQIPAAVHKRAARLLYLDVDVLCMSSLTELWKTDLAGAPLGAVRDPGAPTVGAIRGLPGAPDSVRSDDPYFNSGILLIDVAEWLHSQISEQCLAYLSNHRDELRFPDQDALNLAVHKRWVELDGKWNHLVLYDRDRRAPREYAGIVHFAGPHKPWHEDCPHTTLRSRYLSLLHSVKSTL
jgi:lipopolysaccharide biosynthesis glycosyltransferase